MFTIDPTKGRRDRMVVEAVFGLGEGVVSGQLTPDHYVLARDGRLKRTRLHTAAVRDRPRPGRRHPRGGAAARAAARRRRSPRSSSRAWRRSGVELEERLGGPQDIEWAIQDDELFVLQSRPVTT